MVVRRNKVKTLTQIEISQVNGAGLLDTVSENLDFKDSAVTFCTMFVGATLPKDTPTTIKGPVLIATGVAVKTVVDLIQPSNIVDKLKKAILG